MDSMNSLSPSMQSVINQCISMSQDLVSDMLDNLSIDELDKYTVRDIRDQIIEQAKVYFGMELDPYSGSDVPGYIGKVIAERVNNLSIRQIF